MAVEPTVFPPPDAALDVLEGVARRFELVSLVDALATCRHLLAKPESIHVAVFGGFKAGKSSFINTLAGADILPVSAIPATAVLTAAAGGPELRATVTFLGGETRLVAWQDLAEWVTEEGNPHNTKRVESVRVEAPGLLRWPRLVFLDTPGLGSVFTHNTRTSLAHLPRVEAAILAVSCTQPLSDVDAELLRRLREVTPQLAVLLTKADLCSPLQQNEVLSFVTRQLERAGVSAKVYLWSRQLEFALLREAFCRGFLGPLVDEGPQVAKKIVSHKIRQLVREAGALLDVGLAAAGRGLAEKNRLRQRIAALAEGKAGLPGLLARFEREARAECFARALATLEREEKSLHAMLAQALVDAFGAWRGTLAKAGTEYEAWAQRAISERMAALVESRRGDLSFPLTEFAQSCQEATDLFHREIDEAAREILDVSPDLPLWHADFSPPAQPDVSISFTFDLGLPWLWNTVPARLVRPLFRRHLQRHLTWEVGKNLSRVAAQWGDALESRIAEVSAAARRHLETQARTLANLLANTGTEAEALRTAREQIAALTATPAPEKTSAHVP